MIKEKNGNKVTETMIRKKENKKKMRNHAENNNDKKKDYCESSKENID